MLLARHKFRQNQNLSILRGDFSSFDSPLLFRQDLLHPTVRPLISATALKFVFQDHPGHAHGLEKSLVRTVLRVPGRIEIANERRQLIFLPGVVIIVQRLNEGLVKRKRQFFA